MECNRALNQMLTSSNSVKRGMTRSKSVYQQRNLGTIRQRKSDKRQEKDVGSAEMMMRILRMRYARMHMMDSVLTKTSGQIPRNSYRNKSLHWTRSRKRLLSQFWHVKAARISRGCVAPIDSQPIIASLFRQSQKQDNNTTNESGVDREL